MESHLNDTPASSAAAGGGGGSLGGWLRGFAGAAASATATTQPSQEDEEARLAAEARRTAAAADASGGYRRTLTGFSTAGQAQHNEPDEPDDGGMQLDDEDEQYYGGGDDYAPVSLDDHLAATNRTTNARSSAGVYSSARYGLGNSGAGGGRMDDVSLGRPSARTLVSAESTADDNTRTNVDYNFGAAARTNTHAGLPEYHSDSSGDDDYLTNNGRDGDVERHVSQMEMFEEEEDQGSEMEPDLMAEDDHGDGGHDDYGGPARPTSRTGSSSSANPSPLAGFIGGMFGGGQHLQGRSSRSDDGPPVTMTGRAGLLSNLPGFGAGGGGAAGATTTTSAVRSRSSSMHSLGSSGSKASQQSSLNSLNYGPVVFEAPLNDTEEYDVYKEEPKAYSKGRQRMKRRGNRPSGGSAGSASGGSGDEYGSGSGSGTSGDEYGVGGGGNTTSGSESGEDYLQAAADATNDMLRKKRRGGLKKAGSSSSIDSDLGDAAAMATAAAHRQQQQQHRQEQFQQQQQQQQGDSSTGAGGGSLLDRHLAAGGEAADDAGADGVERVDSRSADNRSTTSVGLYTYGDMYDTDGSSYGGCSHRSPYDGEDESEYSTSPDREGGTRHVAGHDGADGTTLSSLTGQAAASGGDGADASSSARSFGSNMPITRVKQ
jgi:type II secretory pathway pseudopilin PulG